MNNSIEEHNEYSYVYYDNYKNMNYVEPYNLNKPELPNINSVYNYNLREIANKLSCEHQKFKTESNKIYTTNIYNSAFTYIDDISKPLDYDYEKDIYILRGREVTPKSCDGVQVSEKMVDDIITQLSGQSGGKKRKDKKKNDTGKKKTKKGKYKEFLDKKYSKEQLLKKCKELNVKVTTRKNGNIKPVKKETLINKILKLKFS